jgi:hypothetical protein
MDIPPRVIVNFWTHVDKISSPDGCWLWTNKTSNGYGRISWQISAHPHKVKTVLTHRLSYFLCYGAFDPQLFICHKRICPNTLCCNPTHLYAGTQQQNMHDRALLGHTPSGEKSGVRLHPGSHPQGARNGSSKLTDDEIREVFQLNLYMGTRTLAKKFGVTRKQIVEILHRKTYRYVMVEGYETPSTEAIDRRETLVREVRRLHEQEGFSYTQIANNLNLRRDWVTVICRRISYKHID